MSFHVRKLKTSDAEEILGVLRGAFPRFVFERSWWDWFSAGPCRTYGLIDAAGALSGLFSLVDYPEVQAGERRMRASLAGNLCLSPAYQRKNRGGEQSLFVTLSAAVVEHERARGTEAILVVPNPNSAGRLQEMGWHVIDQLVTWSRPNGGAIPGRPLRERKFPPVLDSVADGEFDFRTQRSEEFAAWRLARPGADYACVEWRDGGWAILKKYDDSATGARKLHVMDFYSTSPQSSRDLLGAVASCSDDRDTVDLWLPGSHPLSAIVAETGWQPIGSRPLLAWFASRKPDSSAVKFSYLDCDVY